MPKKRQWLVIASFVTAVSGALAVAVLGTAHEQHPLLNRSGSTGPRSCGDTGLSCVNTLLTAAVVVGLVVAVCSASSIREHH